MVAFEHNVVGRNRAESNISPLAEEVMASWHRRENIRTTSDSGAASISDLRLNTLPDINLSFDLGTTLSDLKERLRAFIDNLNLRPGQLVRDSRTNAVLGRGRNGEAFVNDGKGNQLAINRDGTIVHRDTINGTSLVEDPDRRHSLSSGRNPANHEVVLDGSLTLGRDSGGVYALNEHNNRLYLQDGDNEQALARLGLRRDVATGKWKNTDGWLEINVNSQTIMIPGETGNPIVVDFNTAQIAIGTGPDSIVFNNDGSVAFAGATISQFGENISRIRQIESFEHELEQRMGSKIVEVYTQMNALLAEARNGRMNKSGRLAILVALCSDLASLIQQASDFPDVAAAAKIAHAAAASVLSNVENAQQKIDKNPSASLSPGAGRAAQPAQLWS